MNNESFNTTRIVSFPEFRETRDANAQEFARRSIVLLVDIRAQVEANPHGKSRP
jgi:hypothetical protein